MTDPSPVYPSMDLAECPYPFYEKVRATEPVYKIPGTENEYVISSYDDVRHVLGDPELFSNVTDFFAATNTVGARSSTIGTDPPEHTVQRKLIIQGFTPKRVRGYEPMIQRHVDALLDKIAARGRTEFVGEFATLLPILVMCEILGLPREDEDLERFLRWSTLEGAGTKYLTPELQALHRQWAGEMAAFIEKEIALRVETPRDDFLSELIATQVERDGEIDLSYLLAETRLLILGGMITTAHFIAATLLLLLQNPDELAAIREKPARIAKMLEEALRVESPVQWQARRVTRTTEVGGVDLPEGATLFVSYASANRDEAMFECPAKMDSDRSNVRSHMAFGYGTHFCFGAPLARLEAKVVIETVLRRLSNLRIDPAQTEFTHIPSVTFRGVSELNLLFDAVS